MYIICEHDDFINEQYNLIVCQEFLVYKLSYITSPVLINSLLYPKEYSRNNNCLQV